MIGVIQNSAAPYKDFTYLQCQEKAHELIEVASFPDGLVTHPEWEYQSIKEDYVGNPPHFFKFFGRSLAYNSDIKFWLKKESRSVLIIDGYNSLTNIFALLYAFKSKIPVILGMDTIENKGYKLLKSRLYENVSAFWVPGERSKNYLISEGIPESRIYKGKYTYDLKDIEGILSGIDREKKRSELGLKRDDRVLLFVGKLIPSRKIALLLNAFSQIIGCNLRLIIIGDGPDENVVKNSKDKRLIYIPSVPITNLYDYYAVSDIYVHPGSEPYSLALVQAVAANLVIVSSNAVGASDDVIINGKNGVIFDCEHEDELQLSIKTVLNHYAEMKKNAYKQGEFLRSNRSVEFAANQLYEAINYAKKQL